MSKKSVNDYELVHKVSERARQMEEEDRYPVFEDKQSIYKEVNKSRRKRNYVLEAYEAILQEQADDSC